MTIAGKQTLWSPVLLRHVRYQKTSIISDGETYRSKIFCGIKSLDVDYNNNTMDIF